MFSRSKINVSSSDTPGSAPHAHAGEHHVLPLSMYFGVFTILLVMTVLTVAVSRMGLPPTLSFIVAMAVATFKASLVVGYFMHLKYDSKFHALILFATLFFIGLFFSLTLIDMNSRADFQVEHGNFELQKYEQSTSPKALVPEKREGVKPAEH